MKIRVRFIYEEMEKMYGKSIRTLKQKNVDKKSETIPGGVVYPEQRIDEDNPGSSGI